MDITEFPSGVIEHLGWYVYRLIDPRDGSTFYVGKGKGNRVFAHMRGEVAAADDDELLSNKLKQIREIRLAGLEVIHVIHRHGMTDEKTGFCRINGGNASKIWPYRLFSLPVNKTVPQVTFHHLPDVDIVLCVSCESARCRPEWSVPGETI